MGFATIIALDLGKFKTVCLCHGRRRRGRTRSRRSTCRRPNVRDLLARRLTLPTSRHARRVRDLRQTAGWVHDLCTTAGHVGHGRKRQRRNAGGGDASSARPTATTR
jgi:hypothetical protein